MGETGQISLKSSLAREFSTAASFHGSSSFLNHVPIWMRLNGRPTSSRKKRKGNDHSIWNLIWCIILNSKRFYMKGGGSRLVQRLGWSCYKGFWGIASMACNLSDVIEASQLLAMWREVQLANELLITNYILKSHC